MKMKYEPIIMSAAVAMSELEGMVSVDDIKLVEGAEKLTGEVFNKLRRVAKSCKDVEEFNAALYPVEKAYMQEFEDSFREDGIEPCWWICKYTDGTEKRKRTEELAEKEWKNNSDCYSHEKGEYKYSKCMRKWYSNKNQLAKAMENAIDLEEHDSREKIRKALNATRTPKTSLQKCIEAANILRTHYSNLDDAERAIVQETLAGVGL